MGQRERQKEREGEREGGEREREREREILGNSQSVVVTLLLSVFLFQDNVG